MTQLDRRRLLLTAAAVGAVAGAAVVLEPVSFAYAASGAQTATLTGHIPYGAPDWVYIPVDVPDGVNRISVKYSYDRPTPPPGYDGNALDIGIFEENGGLARFVHDIHKAGGLAVAAHPLATCVACGWKFGYAGMDAVEVWNGPWTADDDAVIANWDNLLVAGGRTGTWIPAVGDSDAHSEPQVIGLPHNVVYADDLDRRSILAGVKAGRVWIAESAAVNLSFIAAGAGRQAGIGQRLEVADDAEVTVTLTVDGAPGATVRLITDQGQRTGTTLPTSGPGTFSRATTPRNSRYVRAEVRRPQPTSTTPDTMVALTNPIFLGRLNSN